MMMMMVTMIKVRDSKEKRKIKTDTCSSSRVAARRGKRQKQQRWCRRSATGSLIKVLPFADRRSAVVFHCSVFLFDLI